MIRNAGGVVTDDEIRSLAISQRLLGTEEIILIHHTDCGMLTFTDDEFKKSIQDETGIKPEWAAEAFPDLDEDVRQSIARIKASPVHPEEGQRARVRLRRRDRQAQRGRRPEVRLRSEQRAHDAQRDREPGEVGVLVGADLLQGRAPPARPPSPAAGGRRARRR